MKAILVGRHTGEVPGIDIVEQRAITWPVTSQECLPVLLGLLADAASAAAVVLFQNTPGQVIAALCRLAADDVAHYHVLGMEPPAPAKAGVVVSTPGERPGKVFRSFRGNGDDRVIADAAAFANPRAVIAHEDGETVVTVDGPPMPFLFSHIEWLL